MAILKNGRTVAGDWRYENIVDKPLINGNEIKENNNSSASLDIFKVISKADFEAPTFTQNPQCVYAVIDTDENIRFHYTNQLESTDPNYKKYVCKDYWPVEELPAEPAVTEVEENVRLSSILYWLKKTYKHPTTEEVYLPGLYGWVPTLAVTTPQTYEWKNLSGIDIDKKTIFASEEGVISTQVGGYHDIFSTTNEVKLIDNVNPTSISQDDTLTYITLPITTYEQYTPNTEYRLNFKYQGTDKAISFTPSDMEGNKWFRMSNTEIILGLTKSQFPSVLVTDYTECNITWLKPDASTISYVNPLYFPLDLTTLKVEDGKITSLTPLYNLSIISDTSIDPSQNEVLQKILNDVLIKGKVVTVNFINKFMLLSSAQVSVDDDGTFITLASTLNDYYLLIKVYYDPATTTVIGGKRYNIQPIKHSVADPGVGSPLATDCLIAVCEDERKIAFVSAVPFAVGTQDGWCGDGNVEVSLDYGETWQDATDPSAGEIARQETALVPGKYEIYVRGVGNTKLNKFTTATTFDSLNKKATNGDTATMFNVYPVTTGDDLDLEIRGNLIYLLDYKKSTTINTQYLFIQLFVEVPVVRAGNLILPPEGMGELSYAALFAECQKLVEPPELPETNLAPGCYAWMFSGCKSLPVAPELPATVLPETVGILETQEFGCYELMFFDCEALTIGPELPATKVTKLAYSEMFEKSGIVATPNILAIDVEERGCQKMFNNCDSLTEITNLYIKNLGAYACYNMFSSCTSLVNIPDIIPLETLGDHCCTRMFYGCRSLQATPQLSATTLAPYCYREMFSNCTWLSSISTLPAMILTEYCYDNMFHACPSLTAGPTLPATTLAPYCYRGMFSDCMFFETAPALPATTLAKGCYMYMFELCPELRVPPELPATTLADSCYASMFKECSRLKTAPALPATTLEPYCYQYMFLKCYALAEAPALPATTLANYSCSYMFANCTSIQEPVDVVALEMKDYCFEYAYMNCTNIYWGNNGVRYIIPKEGTGTEATSWSAGMFSGNSGTLPETSGTPLINKDYHYIPVTTFTFYSKTDVADVQIKNSVTDTPLEYSLDNGKTWTALAVGSQTPASKSVMIKGRICAVDEYSRLEVTGTQVAVKGQLRNEISYKYLFQEQPIMYANELIGATKLANDCYEGMFSLCNQLIAAPQLPATELAEGCYALMFSEATSLASLPSLPALVMKPRCYVCMFSGCEALTAIPENYLPSTELDVSCYNGMFMLSKNITTIPEGLLPATTLAETCYSHMFNSCAGLTVIPEGLLHATTLAKGCYQAMFIECSNLTTPPALPATDMAESCYAEMFISCYALESIPTDYLSRATTLAKGCYQSMFQECTSLKVACELPVTTLAPNCYQDMFNTTAIEEAPELPATELPDWCYAGTFGKCYNLKSIPKLNVTSIGDRSLGWMFLDCWNFKWGTSGFEYRIPTTGTATTTGSWNIEMFTNNSGSLPEGTGEPEIGITYYYIPSTTLTFYSKTDVEDVQIKNSITNTTLKYSLDDGENWDDLPNGSQTPAAKKVIIKGGIQGNGSDRLEIVGTQVAVKGNLLDKISYKHLFKGQNALIYADELIGANELINDCYGGMFQNCAGLTTAPQLPAITLIEGCYQGIFYGCEKLTTAPELPAITLANYCYAHMFEYCSNLTTAPELPATTLAECCYQEMFYGCEKLITPPSIINATNIPNYACYSMFHGCEILKVTPTLPAITLGEECYCAMFEYCYGLTTPPSILPATTLGNSCYERMFSGCSSLTTIPIISATEMCDYCCQSMFSNCTSLTTIPDNIIQATTLAPYCYAYMFSHCNNLTTIPANLLPAMTLAAGCYKNMFFYCEALTEPCDLPATTVAEECYWFMFANCISLTRTVNELPATDLTGCDWCYSSMFDYCESITTGVLDELPATILAPHCYQGFLYKCTGVKKTPTLPATTLADYCYEGMFNSTNIEEIPPLPATIMTKYCYQNMFNNCKNICWGGMGKPYRLPSSGEGTVATNWNKDMFANNSGTLPGSELPTPTPGSPAINTTYYIIPKTTLTFYSKTGIDDVVVTNNLKTVPLKYSIDEGATWVELPVGSSTPVAIKVIVEGFIDQSDLDARRDQYRIGVAGTEVAVSGHLNDLVNYKFLLGHNPQLKYADELICARELSKDCYYQLLAYCDNLITTPQLPATVMAENCYGAMFGACKSLTTPPTIYATTLATKCFNVMFALCESLTTAPALPVTTLVDGCYSGMFMNCTSLTTPPSLPATELAEQCYRRMFSECEALTTAVDLSAVTSITEACCSEMYRGCKSLITTSVPQVLALADRCYYGMFNACTSLEIAPELPATTLAGNCYYAMFSGCTSLTTPPTTLPAETLFAGCYSVMFKNCKALETCPTLPALTLADECYYYMFANCESLTTPPALPATTMMVNCYSYMFDGCSKITWATAGSAYRIPASGSGTPASGWNTSMFTGNGGQIPEGTGEPILDKTYYLTTSFTELTFTNKNSGINDVVITNNLNTAAQFSVDDGTTWVALPVGSSTTPASAKVIIKAAIDNTTATAATPSYLGIAGTNVEVSGELLDGVNYNHLFVGQLITDASELTGASMLCESCYEGMFKNCDQLKMGPKLPATIIATKCYKSMFDGCKKLTTIPELSAITATEECYAYMFNGCELLTSTPELPATTLGVGCYQYMFQGCTSLIRLPKLKALEMKDNCYQNMFYGCKQFIWGGGIPYRLPSTGEGTVATDWSKDMFGENSGENPATPEINKDYSYCLEGMLFFTSANNITIQNSLSYDVYYSTSYDPNWTLLKNGESTTASNILMFKGVEHTYEGTGTYAALPITGSNVTVEGALIGGNNYSKLFVGQNALINASKLNVGEFVGDHGCDSMFKECINLTNHPKLNATIIGESAYSEMFKGCVKLTTMPEIPVETISKFACYHMFDGCVLITTPTQMDVRIVEESGCDSMFKGCTALTAAPLLEHLDGVDIQGCASMFEGCTSLKTASKLATLRTSESCYQYMYKGCTSLEEMPELPAIYSSDNCYFGMFEGCKEIQDVLPDLHALSMSTDCYKNMFFNCDQYIWGEGAPYRIPVRGKGTKEETMEFATDMFVGNSGILPEDTGTPKLNTIYNYIAPSMLIFESVVREITIENNLGYDIFYMLPDESNDWYPFAAGDAIVANRIVLKGVVKGGTSTTEAGLKVTGKDVYVSGKLVKEGNYSYLFYGLSSLLGAGELIGATKLSDGCYKSMFEGCINLQYPMSLPAIQMKPNCYNSMFKNCESIYWSTTGRPFKMPTVGDGSATGADGWNTDMFVGNAGSIPETTGIPNLNKYYYFIPTTTLTFYNRNTNATDVRVTNNLHVPLKYTIDDGETWVDLPIGSTTPENVSTVTVKGITDLRNNTSSTYRLVPTGTEVAVKGNLIDKINYRYMFYDSTQLKYADELVCGNKLDEVQGYDYQYMFYKSGITTLPKFPAKTLSKYCYQYMFYSCKGITELPEDLLPSINLAPYCYNCMFYSCSNITSLPEKLLPAEKLTVYCYQYMFAYCENITSLPEKLLPAETLADYCYNSMFSNCSKLTSLPEKLLPAKVLTNRCYEWMFAKTGLTSLPEKLLPAETLAEGCYYEMFYWCTSLIESNIKIPATKLPKASLDFMFEDCRILERVNYNMLENITEVGSYGCAQLFEDCWALEIAPMLPATKLDSYSYYRAFNNCFKLTAPPTLPATTLGSHCYEEMFNGCEKLESLPVLPLMTMVNSCYKKMFADCKSIAWGPSGIAYRLPSSGAGTEATDWATNMFTGNEGTLPGSEKETPTPGTPAINMTYHYVPTTILTFISRSSNAADVVITNNLKSALKYSVDNGATWIDFAIGTSTTAASKVIVKGPIEQSSASNSNVLGVAGTNVAVSGQLKDKVNYKYLFYGQTGLKYADGLISATTLVDSCYHSMFQNCTSLTTAPNLPAETLAYYCYQNMFYGCASLTIAPVISAKTLAYQCCYSMFYKSGLVTAPELPATNLADNCYQYMFLGCSSLTTPPSTLPAETLKMSCYYGMFQDCTKLITSPIISAKTMAYASCGYMFRNSGLKTAPTISITTSASYCCTYMFYNCTSLETASELTLLAENLSPYCYRDMFCNCTKLVTPPTISAKTMNNYSCQEMFRKSGLKTVPAIPATTTASYCYQYMFAECTSLETASGLTLSAETLASYCYSDMFNGCTKLTTPPTISAKTVGSYSCYGMFRNSGLITAPALPAETMGERCYYHMFSSCTKLTTPPPTLPAKTLANYCYCDMFNGCVELLTPPVISATTLGDYCCYEMFINCKKLASCPTLSAMTMKINCYGLMFKGCEGLTVPCELPATTLAESCYQFMFANCYGLTRTVNSLPATTLAKHCYGSMFDYCRSITTVLNELPAETLTERCYEGFLYTCTSITKPPAIKAKTLGNGSCWKMFYNCTNLQELPVLSATTMVESCYYQMFYGCTKIAWGPSGTAYRLPSSGEGVEATNWAADMFTGNEGTLPGSEKTTPTPGTPAINYDYYYVPLTTLTFESRSSNASDVVITNNLNTALKYSTNNGSTWTDLAIGASTPAAAKVIIKGAIEQTNASNIKVLGIAGTNVAVSGQLKDKVNYKYLFYGQSALKYADGLIGATILCDYSNYNMFYGCTGLVTAPTLPAAKVLTSSYSYMFYNTGLTTAPELPAMEVGQFGYNYMFGNCKSLTSAPALPATKFVGYYNYQSMFYNCVNLITPPPTLPAETLTYYCYKSMFAGCEKLTTAPVISAKNAPYESFREMFYSCKALTTAPELSATTLGDYCYCKMFNYCENLTTPPSTLPAENLASYCYQAMFYGCTKLTTPPTISAKTMGSYSCFNMFRNSGLTTAPTLPAETMGEYCYYYMFASCTKLTTPPPQLPAKTLANYCYNNMFYGCTKLETAPTLSATTLAFYCCNRMFYNCTSLKTLPILPVTTMTENCYKQMFDGCTDIVWKTSGTRYRLPSSGTGTEANGWSDSMFANNSGTLPGSEKTTPTPGTPAINYDYYYIPSTILTFESRNSNASDVVITNNLNTALKYSTNDGSTWTDLAIGSSTPAAAKVIIKGGIEQTNATESTTLGIAGTNVAVSGQLRDNICYKHLFYGQTALKYADGLIGATTLVDYSNYCMFYNCTGLTTPMTLPATTMKAHCYESLFNGCNALTTAPTLPATTLNQYCYAWMFRNCSVLTTPPALPAATMANYCYQNMFEACIALTTSPTLKSESLANGCYTSMFTGCSALASAPALPAKTMKYRCYQYMFYGCKLLTTPPELPATTLSGANECYRYMFSGCTSLTTTPTLSATTLSTSCYRYMFENCTSLTTVSTLTATTLSDACYYAMFSGCTSLTTAPELPATTLTSQCYRYMFNGCNKLKSIPILKAKQATFACYVNMFDYCSQFNWGSGVAYALPPTLDGTPVDNWANSMFNHNSGTLPSGGGSQPGTPAMNTIFYYIAPGDLIFTSSSSMTIKNNLGYTIKAANTNTPSTTHSNLTSGSSISGTTIVLRGVTKGGSSTTAAGLQITGSNVTVIGKLADSGVYKYLFYNQAALVDASGLIGANTLAETCYLYMFGSCTNLITPPTLPATTTVNRCYERMFDSCKKLASVVPQLPALQAANSCYSCMYMGCTSLTTIPENYLPATTLGDYSYCSTFNGCTSLRNPCNLPATTLYKNCYVNTFNGCTSLEYLPALPAKTMQSQCYLGMFANCSQFYWGSSGTSFQLPKGGTGGTAANNWSKDMFANNSGTLPGGGTPAINNTYYYSPQTTLTFESRSSNASDVVIKNNLGITLKYSTNNGSTWTNLASGSSTPAAAKVIIMGLIDQSSASNSKTLGVSGTNVAVSGRLLNNICYKYLFYGQTALKYADGLIGAITLVDYSNYCMFYNCTGLTTPMVLPATTMKAHCYESLFNGCNALKTCPELPATTLNQYCYAWMFSGCKTLTAASKLSATTLAINCCYSMFRNCTSLTTSPALPTAEVLESSYDQMFRNTGLITAPALPATKVGKFGYSYMFGDCGSLTTASTISATSFTDESPCYGMFYNCKKLTTPPPTLPATTLSDWCYNAMFYYCESLTSTPTLPATTLATGCYYNMFMRCTNLKAPATLPAKTMKENCYAFMFSNCTGITWTTDTSATLYKIPSGGGGTAASSWNTGMFENNSGTLPGGGAPAINTPYYYNKV